MDVAPVFLDLGLALALGMLVGLQRERVGSEIAGIRTFALVTLAGAICTSLPDPLTPWAVAAGLLGVAILCWVGNLPRLRDDPSPGMTTEAGMLVMFLVGALVVSGPRSAAVVLSGAIAVLLYAKPILQSFVRKLGEPDVRAIMQFVLIALVILPIVPDEAYDPWDVLNLRELWLLVVLIVGISLAAYVAYRLLGDKVGAPLAGALGGLISSTATTASFSRRAHGKPAAASTAALAILIASTVLGMRLLVILGVAAPRQWPVFAGPIVVLTIAGAVSSLIAWLAARQSQANIPPPKNPAQLGAALIFAGLFAVVLLASALASRYFGDSGTYVVAFVSGLTDMDAISLSLGTQVADGTLGPTVAWRGVVIAFIANTAFKYGMAASLGGRPLATRLAPFMGAQIVLGATLLFWGDMISFGADEPMPAG